jgi:hypothetical protein
MSEACFTGIDPTNYQPHRLHSQDRLWPLTNCSIDLWIEILASMKVDPEAMLAFTVLLDFEGDHFTFFKVPFDDLETLYGLRVQELAIYGDIASHAAVQVERGRLCLIEMDSFYLPDTRALSYQIEHGKTTIAVNRINPEGRRLEYFHNAGCFSLSGEDYDGLMHGYAHGDTPFLPYSEFIKFGAPPTGDVRDLARALLRRHWRNRPTANPVRAFQAVIAEQAEDAAAKGNAFVHRYAFNTLRQLGANFELMSDFLKWLDGEESSASQAAFRISEVAKAAQFQLARACARNRFEPLSGAVEPAALAYDDLFAALKDRIDGVTLKQEA